MSEAIFSSRDRKGETELERVDRKPNRKVSLRPDFLGVLSNTLDELWWGFFPFMKPLPSSPLLQLLVLDYPSVVGALRCGGRLFFFPAGVQSRLGRLEGLAFRIHSWVFVLSIISPLEFESMFSPSRLQ